MSDPVVTLTEGGGEIVRSAEDAAILGSQLVDPSAREAALAQDRRRLMFDTSAHAATTFVEGIVDAVSMGLIRETGEQADLRRSENTGAAILGNAVGFAGSMVAGGPVRAVVKGAEGVGAAAAKQFFRAGEKSIVSRAAQEAASSMALAGGQAFGHQLMDAIIEDKEFSSEAILDEVKLAGVMGAVGGVALGGLSKLATRSADIKAQGGLAGDLDQALKPHYEALRAYDDVLTRHAAEVGAMRQLVKEGQLDWSLVEPRVKALNNAARARDAIDAISDTKALSGADDVAYTKWQKANVKYRAALRELDSTMLDGVPVDTGDLSKLNRLIDQIPVKTDTPAVLRFADTPPQGSVVDDIAGPDFGVPTREQGFSNMAPPVEVPDFGIPTRERGLSALAPQQVVDLTAPGRSPTPAGAPSPNVTSRAGMSTRELPAGDEFMPTPRSTDLEAGTITNANDLPDFHTPGKADLTTSAGKRKTPDTQSVDVPFTDPAMPQSFFDMPPPKARPMDIAEARVQAAMAELAEKAGTRLQSAGGLGLLEQAGIRPAGDNVGAYMDQVYALRKAARAAANPAKSGLKDALGAAIAGGVGHSVGGPVGLAAAGLMYLTRGSRIATAAGRLSGQVAAAATKLLSSTKVRAFAAAAANTPHAYSEAGPIKDPVARIQELQFLAAHPEAIMERVARAASDVADQPELLQALQQRAVNQVQRLAIRAPAIFFDKLGRPLSPPVGRLRDFFEYENAVHDLGSVLDAVGNGTVTRAQADALRDNWTSVSVKMAAAFMQDPEKLQKLGREKLRVVEMVTGMRLTGASDPMFLARQGAAWQPPVPPAPSSKAQAFNINPTGAPTPSQASASGKAPGNQ